MHTFRQGQFKSAPFGNGNLSVRGVSGCSVPSVKLKPPQFFFRLRRLRGAAPPSVNVGDVISSLENVTARKLKFYKLLDGSSAPFGNDIFPQGGISGVQCPLV